jgi:multiple sugar transport system permease protein
MKRRDFLLFVAPSLLSMLLLIALPLVGVVWLALHQSYVKTELVSVTTTVPLFGGLSRSETRVVPQPVIGDDGRPVRVWRYVGADNIAAAAETERLAAAVDRGLATRSLRGLVDALRDAVGNSGFWSALEFTLLYTAVTTPFVLGIGLLLALGIDRMNRHARGSAVFVTLLPMIVTPVVSSLAVYWLFIDGAIVPALLESLGVGRLYFLADKATIRTVLILYGIWYAAPFAFIILFAGLQTVPQDTLESARIDGASALQRLRYVVVPHLAPLFAVITLIHVMDAYRVFEPILVFGSRVFASSVQYLTYYTLAYEGNVHKAAAYALLTLAGVLVLLAPVLVRIWRTERRPA